MGPLFIKHLYWDVILPKRNLTNGFFFWKESRKQFFPLFCFGKKLYLRQFFKFNLKKGGPFLKGWKLRPKHVCLYFGPFPKITVFFNFFNSKNQYWGPKGSFFRKKNLKEPKNFFTIGWLWGAPKKIDEKIFKKNFIFYMVFFPVKKFKRPKIFLQFHCFGKTTGCLIF